MTSIDRSRFPLPGDTIGGRYRLDSVLAKGGMGMVCLGRQLSMDREVAIKMVLPQKINDEQTLKRFQREVHLAKQLRHPNVVELYDFGRTTAGVLYLVMERLEGLDLKQVIKKEAPLSVGRCGHIALQALDALSVAHHRGIVHRDLKPSNLFITKMGRHDDFVKLLDFGIAKSLGQNDETDVTRQGQVCGTSAYMAPEMFLLGSVNLTVDIYAMGIIMLEMLTGRKTFQGKTTAENMMLHLRGEIEFPVQLRGTPLAGVIQRAIGKRPKLRYQHAAEMLDDLELALEETSPDLTASGTDTHTGVAVVAGEDLLEELIGALSPDDSLESQTADSSDVVIIEQETGAAFSAPSLDELERGASFDTVRVGRVERPGEDPPALPTLRVAVPDGEAGLDTPEDEARMSELPRDAQTGDRNHVDAPDTTPVSVERVERVVAQDRRPTGPVTTSFAPRIWIPAGVVVAAMLAIGGTIFFSVVSGGGENAASAESEAAPAGELASKDPPAEPEDETTPEPEVVAPESDAEPDAGSSIDDEPEPTPRPQPEPEPEPVEWTVAVRTTPTGASVYAGEKPLGTTPATLRFRERELPDELRLELDGHVPAEIPVEASAEGGDVELEHEFERVSRPVATPPKTTEEEKTQDLDSLLDPGRFE